MKKLFGRRSGKSASREYRDSWDEMEDLDYIGDFDEEYNDGEYYAEEECVEYVEDEFGTEESEEYYAVENEEFAMEDTEAYYAEEEDAGYYGEDSEEYYADAEDAGYAMEDAEEYYAGDDGIEDAEAFYAEGDAGEYAEGYHAEDDEEYAEEYYTGEDGMEDMEAYYAGDDNGEYAEEYYAEEDNSEYAEGYDEDDEDMEYLREQVSDRSWRKADSGNFFQKMIRTFSRMDSVDRIVACTGVAVLILALVTGTIFAGTRIAGRQVDSFATVGEQLDGIDVIGGDGLLAVADAKMARQEAADFVQEEEQQQEKEGYEEEEYSNEVTVALNMTSIKKDLKIKFVNKKTGKLISNVPFEVTVTDPKGKSQTWKDEDKDGIIYKTEIASGNYTVALNELNGFDQYKISSSAQSVKVKENLDYEKVDVEDEIKTEAEIDAAKEDTAKNDVVEESKLQDTVAWVESTKTAVDESYVEVAKSTIEDPAKLVASFGGFMKLAGSNGETVKIGVNPGSLGAQGSATLTANASDFPSGVTYTWSASGANASLSSASGSSTTLTVNNTETTEQTVTVSVTATAESVSGNETIKYSDTNSVKITVAAGKAQDITLSQTSLSLAVGGSAALSAKQGDATSGFAWASGNAAVATVDQNGKITAVKAGTATITVSRNGASAACTVTVTDTAVTLKLDKASGTVQAGKTLTLTPTITGNATSSNKITWASSNTGIATVSGDNSKATVTGVKKGDATITATYTENGKTVTATCAVKVTANPEQDTTTALKDKSGNQIYVKDAQGKYVAATYADYYKANQKFYIKQQGYKYTGWQTLDGKVYFFDANGNKVTGNQVIQGAQYSFDSNGAMVSSNGILGIDVSKWNGSIDWNAVKNSGVSYVIIRCGYRGSSQGSLVEDPRYRANIQGATSAGLKVGVYFFTQAVNEVEAVEEASMVLSLVKGYKISYPIFLDVESSGGRGDGISKETRTAVCKAFCQTIQNSGYTAGIYANKTWLNNYIDPGQLGAYRIWLAQYASKPSYAGRYDIWQYSSKGQISGISGNVDMNLSYMGY